MATLGSVHHDFPRLAKQSGFYFQLHTGRVNWSEIEGLNLDDIIGKRNYHLLERNLIHVINCNLEKEYDLKILDQNFVKLFKLAQLGIDYLFYCQMYLDRCVVLLQEQLATFQQDYESLKQENEKRKEELNKNKKKNRIQTQSYQCDKCEKVFISDVYLKFHDKRRHNNSNTPNSLDISRKKYTDNGQQTEGRKLSASTQTLFLGESTNHQDQEQTNSLKSEHTVKIEKLEQELKDLKRHLKNAESSTAGKVENSQLDHSNVIHPLNITGSVCCSSMLMLLPAYLKQHSKNYYEINTRYQIPVQGIYQPSAASPVTSEPIKIKSKNENNTECNTQLNPEIGKAFDTELSKEENNPCLDDTESFQEYQSEEKLKLVYDKENMDPNLGENILTNLNKPLPPPRNLKKGVRTQSPASEKTTVEAFATINKDVYLGETEGFSSQSIIHRSTPIKEKNYEEACWEMAETSKGSLCAIKKITHNSTESLNSGKFSPEKNESKSLIKKISVINSPKLRRFSKNLKRSVTNLYDSISSGEKESKKRESNEDNSRAAAVNGLNDRLRELGVDPEWRGIPKKTMKYKLNILKHHRKLLSKENPMFPVIRQNLEEKIFQKIKNNLGKKKSTLINKLTRQGTVNYEDPPPEHISSKDKADFVRVKKSVMYDTDTESESQASAPEGNFNHADQSTSQKSVFLEELTSSDEDEKVNTKKSKEFDFSVFQVGGGNLNCVTEDSHQKNPSVNFFTDSDDNSVHPSEQKMFTPFKGYLSRENSEKAKNSEKAEVSHGKMENRRVIKDKHLQFKVPRSAKKRVLFVNYSDGIENELSGSPYEDDFWPLKSDSEKDVG